MVRKYGSNKVGCRARGPCPRDFPRGPGQNARPIEEDPVKRALIAVVGACVRTASPRAAFEVQGLGQVGRAYFLTPAEKEAWSKVGTDEQAEKFIADYWARRDPNPATTANEFRDDVGRRIAAADEQFKMRSKRGSETNRGRLLVTLGLPSRVSTERAQDRQVDDTGGVTAPAIDTRPGAFDASPAVIMTWTYGKEKFDPALSLPELRVRISVDPQRGTDELMAAAAAERRAIAKVARRRSSPRRTARVRRGDGSGPSGRRSGGAARGNRPATRDPAPAAARRCGPRRGRCSPPPRCFPEPPRPLLR